MFRAAVADLKIILKANYEEQKQLVTAPRQELSTMIGHVGKVDDNIDSATSAAESGGPHKTRKNGSEIYIYVIAMNDYIKTVVALDMVDKTKGVHMFPRMPFGTGHSMNLLEEVENVMVVDGIDEQVSYVKKRVRVGRTEQFVATFLDRTSGRLNDAVLSKLISAFFAQLFAQPNIENCLLLGKII